jgi:1-deoxy-D-xylulose-5-phosphate reductoisomerase
MRRLTVLGSTGSVGTQALDVVRRHPGRWEVDGLAAAGGKSDLLIGQIREFRPSLVAIADESVADRVHDTLDPSSAPQILTGPDAAERLATATEAELVLNALVGSRGLGPTLAALQSGKTLALANKESLVAGGELVTDLIKGEPERLLPVDSEHAALSLALRGERMEDVDRLVVTGSGGPFRGWTPAELAKASVKEALRHPVWAMGSKITIDSATLMNKGLEVIEAHHLFGIDYDRIDVVIHPQGLVHAMVSFTDGSLRAELARPDMRLPIQLALAWPERLSAGLEPLPLTLTDGPLSFEPPDREAFPALALAERAGRLGSTYPAVLNAANEVAVEAFLAADLPFPSIAEVVAAVVDEHESAPVVSLVAIERADAWARRRAAELTASVDD